MRKTGKFSRKLSFLCKSSKISCQPNNFFLNCSLCFTLSLTCFAFSWRFSYIFAIDFREKENFRFRPKCDHCIYSQFIISQFRHISSIATESRQLLFIKSGRYLSKLSLFYLWFLIVLLAYLLDTWEVVSSPPCRRVADTSVWGCSVQPSRSVAPPLVSSTGPCSRVEQKLFTYHTRCNKEKQFRLLNWVKQNLSRYRTRCHKNSSGFSIWMEHKNLFMISN